MPVRARIDSTETESFAPPSVGTGVPSLPYERAEQASQSSTDVSGRESDLCAAVSAKSLGAQEQAVHAGLVAEASPTLMSLLHAATVLSISQLQRQSWCMPSHSGTPSCWLLCCDTSGAITAQCHLSLQALRSQVAVLRPALQTLAATPLTSQVGLGPHLKCTVAATPSWQRH